MSRFFNRNAGMRTPVVGADCARRHAGGVLRHGWAGGRMPDRKRSGAKLERDFK